MIIAIKKHHFKSWPGLTPQIISKHLPTPITTIQGHLHQERQNLQSTKHQSNPERLSVTRIEKFNIQAFKEKTIRAIHSGCLLPG